MGEKSICKFYIESSKLILWLSQKTYKEAREWIEDLPAEHVNQTDILPQLYYVTSNSS